MKRQSTFFARTADGYRRRFSITPAVESTSYELVASRRAANSYSLESWQRIPGISVSGDDVYVVVIDGGRR